MSLILIPVMQYEDTNGIPLRFAKAYFTQTGTTTPVAVYQDNDYNNAHTDPVEADSQGLFPAIFYDPSLGLIRCRIIPEDGDLDNPMIDVDPVNLVEVNGLNGKVGIDLIIDGAGADITTGVKGYRRVPYAFNIDDVCIVSGDTGDIQIDIWIDSFANHPPTNADSVTAAAPPALTGTKKYYDNTLTGWTTTVAAGSVIGYNVDSCTGIQNCTITLGGTKA